MDTEPPVDRQYVLELIKEKEATEARIKQLSEVLKSNNIAFDESLTDNLDFPRTDIDVYQVRHARHDLACLRNDLKTQMTRIESCLHVLHATEKASNTATVGIPKSLELTTLRPFAKIDSVADGSPASKAGLQSFDQILEFGSVRFENFQSMQSIASVVQHSIGRPVYISIRRNVTNLRVTLTPATWSGPGLIGCHMVACKN